MKQRLISALTALIIVALIAFGYIRSAQHRHADNTEQINPKEIIYEHLGDAYGWEIPFCHDVRIPLPMILIDSHRALHVFSSSRLTDLADGQTYNNFKIAHGQENNGKVVEVLPDGSQVRPWDFSVTKNVAAIFVAALLVVTMIMGLRRWHRNHPRKAPRGFVGMIEFVADYVYSGTIRPIMGAEAPKYAPYLLTVFFFILTMNLLGLIVIFPGGANLTGNLAVTMVLALCTFLVINFTGTREYWKEIFWPDVPLALKCPVPMMPLIEVLGMFTKPLALMVRLFANMMGGHMVVIVLTLLIFIFTQLFGYLVGGITAALAMAFSLFMLALDTLVSLIQAYVFTILSAIFISMAHIQPHHKPTATPNE